MAGLFVCGECGGLLFLFFAGGLLRIGDDLVGNELRDDVVVVHLHVEAAAALGRGREGLAVGEHLRHGHFGVDDGVRAVAVHALHATTALVEVAHERAGKLLGSFDLDAHDGFQQGGLGLLHALAEGDAPGHFEGQLVGVDVVVAAVVDRDAKVDDGIAGEVAAGG